MFVRKSFYLSFLLPLFMIPKLVALKKKGICAHSLNSSMSKEECDELLADLYAEAPRTKLLYLTPEQLEVERTTKCDREREREREREKERERKRKREYSFSQRTMIRQCQCTATPPSAVPLYFRLLQHLYRCGRFSLFVVDEAHCISEWVRLQWPQR